MTTTAPAPQNAPNKQPRCIIVGSITGNTNTLAGNVPPKANLGDLSGLASNSTMMDGMEFNGAKAYKDSKVGVCMSRGGARVQGGASGSRAGPGRRAASGTM
jgi:hypothetical protein